MVGGYVMLDPRISNFINEHLGDVDVPNMKYHNALNYIATIVASGKPIQIQFNIENAIYYCTAKFTVVGTAYVSVTFILAELELTIRVNYSKPDEIIIIQ